MVKNEKNKDQDNKNILFQTGKFKLSSIHFLIIVTLYSAVVLTLKYKFDSKIAEFLYQISFFAAAIFIIFIIYRILKLTAIYIKNKYFE